MQVGKNNISDAGAEMAVDVLKKMPNINLKLLDLSVSCSQTRKSKCES